MTVDPARADAILAGLRGSATAGDPVAVWRLDQLEGGWSRHSYRAVVADADGGERSVIVRVRPADTVLDSDLEAEFRTYRALEGHGLPTPRVHGCETAEETPFGGPFFTMEFLPGHAVNVWRPGDRDELEADWNGARGIAGDFVDHLATLHAIPVDALAGTIATRDFTATVDHWQAMYERVRIVRDPIVDEGFAWVRSREPDPVAPRIVHGDYRIGNCLIDGGRVTGLIDWELAYVGDPRFDLGYLSQPYQAGKFVTPGSSLLGAVADREWLLARYAERTGTAVDPEVIRTYAGLGALMHVAIMSVGIRVYADGGTDDIRLAWSRFVLPGLRQDLVAAMGW